MTTLLVVIQKKVGYGKNEVLRTIGLANGQAGSLMNAQNISKLVYGMG